ncbi:aspartate/glutamate racemase family protein [Candidatus Saccharibacteria bacterium]|nr:aspartate/glutamate racemase family protein [Candidatus Saccharibacteria bacterium]
MKIGVFDSGIGGAAIAASLRMEFPDAIVVVASDGSSTPISTRSHTEVIELTEKAVQVLLKAECDVIVIACNTATAAAIEELQALHPEVSFIGLDPLMKIAAQQTVSGTIAVCATRLTLVSKHYQALKRYWAHDLTVLEPDCSEWPYMKDPVLSNRYRVSDLISEVITKGADIIVLGSTQYGWIKETISLAARGRATVLDPAMGIGQRVRELLEFKGVLPARRR